MTGRTVLVSAIFSLFTILPSPRAASLRKMLGHPRYAAASLRARASGGQALASRA